MKALVLGLFLATAVIYTPVLKAPFVYEDANWLPELHPTRTLTWMPLPSRYLTMASFLGQSGPDGSANPKAYHALNVGLHLTCGLLVLWLARELRLTAIGAALALGVFLLHPLQTQAVAYVSARSELLMTLGTLLALTGSFATRPVISVPVCVAGLSLAVMSKEVGLVAPLLVLWTCIVLRRWLMVTLLSFAALLAGIYGLPRVLLITYGLPDFLPWIEGVSVQIASLARIVGLMILPVGLSLDPDPVATTYAFRFAALLALTCLAGTAWLFRADYPLAFWGVGWIALALLPRVLLPQGEPIHDHHAYLALVGFSIGVASGLQRLVPQGVPAAVRVSRVSTNAVPW